VITFSGGVPGVLNDNAIHAAVQRPDSGFGGLECFPTLFLKAAALAHSVAAGHPFLDGNKRTALGVAAVMLRLNGYRLVAEGSCSEATMVSLALKELSLEDFARWLEDHAEPL